MEKNYFDELDDVNEETLVILKDYHNLGTEALTQETATVTAELGNPFIIILLA